MLQMVLNNEVLMEKIHPNREFWAILLFLASGNAT